MAIGVPPVQTAKGANQNSGSGDISNVSATWGSTTGNGNFLIAALCFFNTPGTVTPPTGWTLLTSGNNSTCWAFLYQAINAASQSGAQQWSWTTAVHAAALVMAEYSGVAKTGPQDGATLTNSGSSTSPSTNTIRDNGANEVNIAIVAQSSTTSGATSFSSPTNSFAIESQENALASSFSQAAVAILDKLESAAGGTDSTGCTSNKNSLWLTAIIAFSPQPNQPNYQPVGLGPPVPGLPGAMPLPVQVLQGWSLPPQATLRVATAPGPPSPGAPWSIGPLAGFPTPPNSPEFSAVIPPPYRPSIPAEPVAPEAPPPAVLRAPMPRPPQMIDFSWPEESALIEASWPRPMLIGFGPPTLAIHRNPIIQPSAEAQLDDVPLDEASNVQPEQMVGPIRHPPPAMEPVLEAQLDDAIGAQASTVPPQLVPFGVPTLSIHRNPIIQPAVQPQLNDPLGAESSNVPPDTMQGPVRHPPPALEPSAAAQLDDPVAAQAGSVPPKVLAGPVRHLNPIIQPVAAAQLDDVAGAQASTVQPQFVLSGPVRHPPPVTVPKYQAQLDEAVIVQAGSVPPQIVPLGVPTQAIHRLPALEPAVQPMLDDALGAESSNIAPKTMAGLPRHPPPAAEPSAAPQLDDALGAQASTVAPQIVPFGVTTLGIHRTPIIQPSQAAQLDDAAAAKGATPAPQTMVGVPTLSIHRNPVLQPAAAAQLDDALAIQASTVNPVALSGPLRHPPPAMEPEVFVFADEHLAGQAPFPTSGAGATTHAFTNFLGVRAQVQALVDSTFDAAAQTSVPPVVRFPIQKAEFVVPPVEIAVIDEPRLPLVGARVHVQPVVTLPAPTIVFSAEGADAYPIVRQGGAPRESWITPPPLAPLWIELGEIIAPVLVRGPFRAPPRSPAAIWPEFADDEPPTEQEPTVVPHHGLVIVQVVWPADVPESPSPRPPVLIRQNVFLPSGPVLLLVPPLREAIEGPPAVLAGAQVRHPRPAPAPLVLLAGDLAEVLAASQGRGWAAQPLHPPPIYAPAIVDAWEYLAPVMVRRQGAQQLRLIPPAFGDHDLIYQPRDAAPEQPQVIRVPVFWVRRPGQVAMEPATIEAASDAAAGVLALPTIPRRPQLLPRAEPAQDRSRTEDHLLDSVLHGPIVNLHSFSTARPTRAAVPATEIVLQELPSGLVAVFFRPRIPGRLQVALPGEAADFCPVSLAQQQAHPVAAVAARVLVAAAEPVPAEIASLVGVTRIAGGRPAQSYRAAQVQTGDLPAEAAAVQARGWAVQPLRPPIVVAPPQEPVAEAPLPAIVRMPTATRQGIYAPPVLVGALVDTAMDVVVDLLYPGLTSVIFGTGLIPGDSQATVVGAAGIKPVGGGRFGVVPQGAAGFQRKK